MTKPLKLRRYKRRFRTPDHTTTCAPPNGNGRKPAPGQLGTMEQPAHPAKGDAQ